MDNFEAKLCVENVKLLDELKKDINIRFEKWGQNHWGAKLTDSDSVGIVYCPNEFSDAKIAHELLHLKIGHIMGHNGYLHLQAALHPPYISRIFTDEVLTHLLNSYEHMKIIDEYRAMGFSDNDFFDENVNQIQTTYLLQTIKERKFFTNGGYKLNDLFFYITSTISFLSYPLDPDKWKKEIKMLYFGCKPLYKIIEQYWNAILLIPINSNGKTQLDREHEKFITNLSEWLKNIKIHVN